MKKTQRIVDILAVIFVIVGILSFIIAWASDVPKYWIQDLKFSGGVLIVNLFLASVLIAFPARAVVKPLRYLSSILLAFIFTVGMLAVLAIGQSQLNNSNTDKQAESFGPLTVFQYSDTSAIENEWQWAVSLSAGVMDQNSEISQDSIRVTYKRGETTISAGLTKGFWAPVWVLFLATLGAGLLTVSLIVKELSDRPKFKNQSEMRERLGQILQHQFFILFSPIGGIFVYQALISIGAAGKTMTVALAALGAGASLNFLLEKAVRASKNALGRKTKEHIDQL